MSNDAKHIPNMARTTQVYGEYAPRIDGKEDSDNRTVTVTINNHTSGSISFNSKSTTGGDLDMKNNTIDAGESKTAFVASGPSLWYSGCGGQVSWNLPNGLDRMVVVYNCTTTGDNCTTFVELQNADGENPGCSNYFAVVNPGAVLETSMSTTVDLYEAGASANGQTGVAYDSYVQIAIENKLDSWITLNAFDDVKYTGIYPVVTDGTTSVAPGTTAVVLASFGSYDFAQVFNLNSQVLLTVTQQESDTPTAGLSAAGPYSTSVSGGYDSDKGYYYYTVTVQSS